ncbi:hypothetical protein EII17_08555 [Clostridiales bacterium COT073_COT-073]|nr:hypothetical protein EII17_08555 [Clostridiales bacterium COT073_COT-073]
MIKLKHYGYWSLILLALCFGFSPNHVSAAAYERGYEIVPFWQELTSIATSLTAERNQLECECVILANEMDCPIIGTMSLENYWYHEPGKKK